MVKLSCHEWLKYAWIFYGTNKWNIFLKKKNKTKQEMLISFDVFNVLISKTSVGYWGELSVANRYLTSRGGMFVCFQGILLNTLSEFLRKMEKYKAFPRPHSTCDCIITDLILFTHGLAVMFMYVPFLSLLVYWVKTKCLALLTM